VTKVLFVLEYDVDVDALDAIAERVLDNVAIVSEEGIRPVQAHIVTEVPAIKILSLLKAHGDD